MNQISQKRASSFILPKLSRPSSLLGKLTAFPCSYRLRFMCWMGLTQAGLELTGDESRSLEDFFTHLLFLSHAPPRTAQGRLQELAT